MPTSFWADSNAANFCRGDIPLVLAAAERAVALLAQQLEEPVEQTAHAIIDLANHNMVDALNVISVERGIDPRDFALVAFGGAGALHAAEIIGIRTVLVPLYPGNTSTFGLLTANLRSDLSTRDIVITPEAPLDEAAFGDAVDRFHDDYEAFYGYGQRDEIVEVVGLVVTAIGPRPGPRAELRPGSGNAPATQRPAYFRQTGFADTLVVQRHSLAAGETLIGPAIVEEALSTTVVPPDTGLRVHESGSLIITSDGGSG